MFEITGDHIARLGDADLRTLVARLSLAELGAQGLPRSGVTAGGHQDAKDGGIDVRVDVTGPMPNADFVPRNVTGFQVKRPDMPASEITKEMRPEPANTLRLSIERLAERDGAYVIVSAQGSVADKPLEDRRQAIRNAIADCPSGERLHTDFYDRVRLATWTNLYPGAAAWVRARIGETLSGWSAIGTWNDLELTEGHPYLVSTDAKVIGERTGGGEAMSVPQGLDALRTKLSEPRHCIRLIGMSGVGKTRFVKALFESGVGEMPPLDPTLAVYTDYAEDIAPTAREMARRLIATRQRAILVVDNCNPITHGELAAISSAANSTVSLLTVEYDVRDDEPEHTEVFRLVGGSGKAVEEWIRREFPHVSQVDRRTIAEFSAENFRVARALAETLHRGETLGQLRNQDLFARLFFQRNAPDQQLLRDAEILALAYSYDGEDASSGGEMSALGSLTGRGVRDLFSSTAELRARDIVQTRGRWRAVLPQAIATRLAAGVLARVLPSDFDALCRTAPPRLLKSISRRLGYLHDSAEARAAVSRLLKPTGPLGNIFDLGVIGLEILTNIAPASPDVVLAALEHALTSENGQQVIAPANHERSRWVRLLKGLAYTPELFDRAGRMLAQFAGAEPDGFNTDPARGPFAELFHIYLSGTKASPDQRRKLAYALLLDSNSAIASVGLAALDALLKTAHFSSSTTFDFGARPRDFGWSPATGDDVNAWYSCAIDLAINVSATIRGARSVLGKHVRGLWRIEHCRSHIEAAANHFLKDGAWIDGWIGLRASLRWDGDGENIDRPRLEALIDRLKPIRLLDRTRAVVLSQHNLAFDVADGEDTDPVKAYQRASEHAVDLGRTMAADDEVLATFLAEVSAQKTTRAFEFGKGLAQGTSDVETAWDMLSDAYRAADVSGRNAGAMGGFVTQLQTRESETVRSLLEAAIHDDALRLILPYLQSRAGLDGDGLDRLCRLADGGRVPAHFFLDLQSGVIKHTEAARLIQLLQAIERLDSGLGVALGILYFQLAFTKDKEPPPKALVEYGRQLLSNGRFGDDRQSRDHHLGGLVELCFKGPEAADAARQLCKSFLEAVRAYKIYAFDSHFLISAIFKAQPVVALDCLVDPENGELDNDMFKAQPNQLPTMATIDVLVLIDWANIAPERRYSNLGRALPIFKLENLDDAIGLSEHFVTLLRRAPNKAAFLGNPYFRIYPDGWAGPLSAILEQRKAMLMRLADIGNADVNAWLAAANTSIDNWIARERERESAQEEAFE
jgi:hypothetical protein